jgi:hypothetical protein
MVGTPVLNHFEYRLMLCDAMLRSALLNSTTVFDNTNIEILAPYDYQDVTGSGALRAIECDGILGAPRSRIVVRV